MEIKNEYYKEYLKDLCKDVPTDVLGRIVFELGTNARFYMNSDTNVEDMSKINDAIVDLLKTRFGWLPLYLVGEAYVKGSLGEIGGTTKLSVRNVYIWLSNIDEKARTLRTQDVSRLDNERRTNEERIFKLNQAHNVSFGTALYLKLSWLYSGAMTANQWDEITLDKIVHKLKNGYTEKTLTPSKL